MRFISTILVLVILACIAAIVTKPTDEKCLELVKSKVNSDIYSSSSQDIVNTLASSIVDIGVNSLLFRVEDKFLYKEIYFKMDNSKVGIILFGSFFANNDNQTNSSVNKNDMGSQDINAIQAVENDLKNETDNQTIPATPTEWPKEISWVTFHHKYGFSIDLPDFFTKGSLTASGLQYYDNPFSEEIMIVVGTEIPSSSNELLNSFRDESKNANVTYKLLKDRWYVISGKDNDGGYFYNKTLSKGDNLFYLQISYTEEEKNKIEPLLARIQGSLR